MDMKSRRTSDSAIHSVSGGPHFGLRSWLLIVSIVCVFFALLATVGWWPLFFLPSMAMFICVLIYERNTRLAINLARLQGLVLLFTLVSSSIWNFWTFVFG